MRIAPGLTLFVFLLSQSAPVLAEQEKVPMITKATVNEEQNTITVELSQTIKNGYISYERYGSGNGYDYSGMQYRADNKKVIVLENIRESFRVSGTTGTQTITIRPCIEHIETTDNSVSCGASYTLMIELGGTASFGDVPEYHKNAEAIRYVQQQGIVAGYADDTFKPDNVINRAEFTKIVTLYRFGQEMINMCATPLQFTDVQRNEWYAQYLCRAQDSHLIDGYPDGTFRPASHINFAEAAKIIALADISGNPDKVLPESGSMWYEQYVRYLANHNAIPPTIGMLASNLTRGEMAEIIYRLRTGITYKPSKIYEHFLLDNKPAPAGHRLMPLTSYKVNNFARNIVYRYAVTAPTTESLTIKSESFTITGGRWTGPQLRIYSDVFFTNQIDTWASDDNWTNGDAATLHGSLLIPAGETRYVELTVSLGTPAGMGFAVTAKHSDLPLVTLTDTVGNED